MTTLAEKFQQRTTSEVKPTEEQQAILEAVLLNHPVLVVEAGAGAGKTSTLKMIGKTLPGRGQYTAFNSSLVAESKTKFAGSAVACNTTHSLAFQAEGTKYAHRLGGNRVRMEQVAKMLGIEAMALPFGEGGQKRLAAGFLASQVQGAVRRFCQSADTEIQASHFRYLDGIDMPVDGVRQYTNNGHVRDYLLPFARKMWTDLCNVDGVLPFSHDHYVKIWQLNKPVISAGYILSDESQDMSEVMLDVLKQQTCPVIMVGDSAQQIYCQPTGTKVMKSTRTGRVSWDLHEENIEDIQVGDNVVSYSSGFRLGRLRTKGCRVSSIVRRTIDEVVYQVDVDGCRTRYTSNHHCIVMLGNAALGKSAVYMQRKENNYRVGVCAGVYGSQGGHFGPLLRAKQEGADCLWVLRLFNTKKEAWEYERHLLTEFPGSCFQSSGGADWWDVQLPNEETAKQLLIEHNRDINEPLMLLDGKWVDKTRIPIVTAARNLLPGMLMLPMKNIPYSAEDRYTVLKSQWSPIEGYTVLKSQWSPIEVSRYMYSGDVISLSVEGDHTYIADGVITHNCWRGAVNAMASFPDAPRLQLSQSFRFGPAIADVANAVLETLEEPTRLRLRGFDKIQSKVEVVASPTAILCRTNAVAVARLLGAIAEGKQPHLIGGGSDVVSFVEGAIQLQRGTATGHPDLACFSSWSEVQEYVKQEEGEDLKLLVKIIDEFEAGVIVAALKGMPEESQADVVISTAHKSKGREWDTVRLAQDFPVASKCCDADRKLLYVAVTRAKLVLDVTQCPFFSGQDSLDIRSIRDKYRSAIPEAAQEGMNPPAPSLPPAVTQFTWSKYNEQWVVRGPKGRLNETVPVVRRDGSSQNKKLISVIQEFETHTLYRS